MENSMRVTLNPTKEMEKEFITMQAGMFMRVNTVMTRELGKGKFYLKITAH